MAIGQCRTNEFLTIQKPPIHFDAGGSRYVYSFTGTLWASTRPLLQGEPSWLHLWASHSFRLFTLKQIWIQLLLWCGQLLKIVRIRIRKTTVIIGTRMTHPDAGMLMPAWRCWQFFLDSQAFCHLSLFSQYYIQLESLKNFPFIIHIFLKDFFANNW